MKIALCDEIRTGLDPDGPAMAHLIATIFAEYPDCPFVPAEFPELSAPASHYQSRGGQLWVATDKGALIGSLAVFETHEKGVFALAKVYVAMAARRSGIAALLLEKAETFAAAQGGRILTLWSDTRFTAGHAFYRRQGFQQEAGVKQLHDVAQSVEFRFSRPIRAARR
jgi:putative acetyltransferase